MNIWKPVLIATLCLSQGFQNVYATTATTNDVVSNTALRRLRGAIKDLEEIPNANFLAESLKNTMDVNARRLERNDDEESDEESNSGNGNNKLDNIANILQSIFDRLEILNDINQGIGHVKDETWEIHQLMNQLVENDD